MTHCVDKLTGRSRPPLPSQPHGLAIFRSPIFLSIHPCDLCGQIVRQPLRRFRLNNKRILMTTHGNDGALDFCRFARPPPALKCAKFMRNGLSTPICIAPSIKKTSGKIISRGLIKRTRFSGCLSASTQCAGQGSEAEQRCSRRGLGDSREADF
jgi:hypothetical protein